MDWSYASSSGLGLSTRRAVAGLEAQFGHAVRRLHAGSRRNELGVTRNQSLRFPHLRCAQYSSSVLAQASSAYL